MRITFAFVILYASFLTEANATQISISWSGEITDNQFNIIVGSVPRDDNPLQLPSVESLLGRKISGTYLLDLNIAPADSEPSGVIGTYFDHSVSWVSSTTSLDHLFPPFLSRNSPNISGSLDEVGLLITEPGNFERIFIRSGLQATYNPIPDVNLEFSQFNFIAAGSRTVDFLQDDSLDISFFTRNQEILGFTTGRYSNISFDNQNNFYNVGFDYSLDCLSYNSSYNCQHDITEISEPPTIYLMTMCLIALIFKFKIKKLIVNPKCLLWVVSGHFKCVVSRFQPRFPLF